MTRRRKRLDEIAVMNGWTHRMKNKSRDPYVKLSIHYTPSPDEPGAIFTDMDQKFRFIHFKDVVEL